MKKYILILLFVCGCFACQSSEDSSAPSKQTIPMLSENEQVSGTIDSKGNVDWYQYRTRRANSLLHIQCTDNTLRPDTELLVTAYQKNDDGTYERLYADHAPENSVLPTNLQMNLFVKYPQDIYLSVRDFMDDDISNYPYYLKISESELNAATANIESATPITIDDPDECAQASITTIGQYNQFQFTVMFRGIYDIQITPQTFQNTTSVVFSVEIFNAQGTRIMKHQPFHNHETCYPLLLTPGTYRMVISDSGQDNADPSASCHVCIQSRSDLELAMNDNLDRATQLGEISAGSIQIDGRLAYINDKDCYAVQLSSDNDNALAIMQLEFHSLTGHQGTYQIDYYDTDQMIRSHEYISGNSAYKTLMNIQSHENALCVHAVETNKCDPMAYTAQLTLSWIDDPDEKQERQDEITGEWKQGNNTIDTANTINVSQLTSTVDGKIAYQGDEDWYALSVNKNQASVLEVFFNTQNRGPIEYRLSILTDAVPIRQLSVPSASEETSFLKTSIWLPPDKTTETYFLRICDDLGNDAFPQEPYSIQTVITPTPLTISDADFGVPTVYFHESKGVTSGAVTLQMYDHSTQSFKVDTVSLQVDNPLAITQLAEDTFAIEYPWIGGYIDYQGDHDFFQIRLDASNILALNLDESFISEQWYYDIAIDFKSPGSSVEYVWKLFRNSSGNKELIDRQNVSNGFFASAGDTNFQSQAFQMHHPESDQQFWVGNEWAGNFYLCITDFNNVTGDLPDDDWGYDAPYYFKLRLVYHPGMSRPLE
jgi:hypothetical protein